MMTASAGMSEIAVRLVGTAVTVLGNRGRDRGGDVAVRGNSNLPAIKWLANSKEMAANANRQRARSGACIRCAITAK
jgi:hypothetical protein